MKFNTCTGITWSLLELTGLLEDEDSHVCFEKTKKHLGLHPFHLTNLQTALNEILSASLNVYDAELKGFLIAYKNPKLLTPLGEILYDTCFIHIDVEVDFYIFRPQVGCSLKGIVNKKGLSHIGLLVHKAFNVSIPKPDNSDDWSGDKVDIGQEVRCTVTHLDCTSKLPFIRGSLSEEDYLYGCKIFKSNIDDMLFENDTLNETVDGSNVDVVSPYLQSDEDPQYTQELSSKNNKNKHESNMFYDKSDQKEKKRSKKTKIVTETESIDIVNKTGKSLINSPERLQNNGNELHENSSGIDQHEDLTTQINNSDKIQKNKKKSVKTCLQESRLSDTEDNSGGSKKASTILHEKPSKEATKLRKGSKKVRILNDSDYNDTLKNNTKEDSQHTTKKQTKRPILINSPFRETNNKSVKSAVTEELAPSKEESKKSRLPNLENNDTEDKSRSEMFVNKNVSSNTKKRSKKGISSLSEEHVEPKTTLERSISHDESTLHKKRSKKHKPLEPEDSIEDSVTNNSINDSIEPDIESARCSANVSSPQKRSKKNKLHVDNIPEVKVKHEKLLTNDESDSFQKSPRKSRSLDVENSFTDVEIKSEKISQKSPHSSKKRLRELECTVFEDDHTNVDVKSEESLTSDTSKASKKRAKKSTTTYKDEPGTSLPDDTNTSPKKRSRKTSLSDIDNLQDIKIKSEESTDDWSSSKKRSKKLKSPEDNEIYSQKGIQSENLSINEETDCYKKRSGKSRVNDQEDNPVDGEMISEETVAKKELSSSKKSFKKLGSPVFEQTYSEVRVKSEEPVLSDEFESCKKRLQKSSIIDEERNDVKTEADSIEVLANSDVSTPRKRSKKRKLINSFPEVIIKSERPATSDESDFAKTKSRKSRVANFNGHSAEDDTNLENSVNSVSKSSKKRLKKSISPVPEEKPLSSKLSSDLDNSFAEVRIKSEKSSANDESETSKNRSKKSSSSTMDNHMDVRVKSEPIDDSPSSFKKRSRIVETLDDDANFAEVTIKSENSLLNNVSDTSKKRSKKSKSSVVTDDFAEVKVKSEQ